MRTPLDLLNRPQPQHLERPVIQFPAVVLPHPPILSDQPAKVDLLMNCLVTPSRRTVLPPRDRARTGTGNLSRRAVQLDPCHVARPARPGPVRDGADVTDNEQQTAPSRVRTAHDDSGRREQHRPAAPDEARRYRDDRDDELEDDEPTDEEDQAEPEDRG